MTKLAEYRRLEAELAAQLQQLDALKNDDHLKREIQFEQKLRALIADSTPFGHSAHADPDTCSTLIRTGSRSAATQGWHC